MIEWTEQLEDSIVQRLINRSLRRICEEDKDVPSRESIRLRMVENDDFWAKCARARKANALQRLETAQDELDSADAKEISQPAVKLIELKLGDARWLAERLLSKDYGNKVKNEHTGKDGEPLSFVVKSILDKE